MIGQKMWLIPLCFIFSSFFHLYLHAFVNARSRKRLFQDALFFDGFAFRHRERTKKTDFSVFFLAQLCVEVQEKRRVA